MAILVILLVFKHGPHRGKAQFAVHVLFFLSKTRYLIVIDSRLQSAARTLGQDTYNPQRTSQWIDRTPTPFQVDGKENSNKPGILSQEAQNAIDIMN